MKVVAIWESGWLCLMGRLISSFGADSRTEVSSRSMTIRWEYGKTPWRDLAKIWQLVAGRRKFVECRNGKRVAAEAAVEKTITLGVGKVKWEKLLEWSSCPSI